MSWLARTSRSRLRKARASLAACQLVELLQLQLPPQLLEELLLQLLPRWRRKRRRKMMTWVLVFSIRTFPLTTSAPPQSICAAMLRRSLIVIVVAFEIYNYY